MEIIVNSGNNADGFSEKKRREQLLVIQENILDSMKASYTFI